MKRTTSGIPAIALIAGIQGTQNLTTHKMPSTPSLNDPEFFSFLTGKKLGSGCFRDVYKWKPDPSLVLKVAKDEDGRKYNFMEHAIWEQVESTPHAKWFAPAVRVSDCGKYLLMKKAKVASTIHHKRKIPAFFGDTHCGNFGWIGKQFVCIDYGIVNLTKGFKLIKKTWCDCNS